LPKTSKRKNKKGPAAKQHPEKSRDGRKGQKQKPEKPSTKKGTSENRAKDEKDRTKQPKKISETPVEPPTNRKLDMDSHEEANRLCPESIVEVSALDLDASTTQKSVEER